MSAVLTRLSKMLDAVAKKYELGPMPAGSVRVKVSTKDTDALEAELDPRELSKPLREYTKISSRHPITWDADKTEVVVLDHLEVANVFEL